MSRITLALTLIFFISNSGSAHAEGHNTRWILITADTYSLDTPDTFTFLTQARDAYRDESECYTALKKYALGMNKIKSENSKKFGDSPKFRIEILNDIMITARAKDSFQFQSVNCLEITLD